MDHDRYHIAQSRYWCRRCQVGFGIAELHANTGEGEDTGIPEDFHYGVISEGEEKREMLIDALMIWRTTRMQVANE